LPHTRDSFDAPDLLVIGVGSTGAIALRAAREAGVNASGIDLRPDTNGDTDGIHHGVRAWGVFGDGTVACSTGQGALRLKPRAIIVATGATDLPLPLPGWERRGVMGAWAGARSLAPGTRVVVLRGPHAGLAGRVPALDHLDIIEDIDLATGEPVTIDGGDRVSSVTSGDRTIPAGQVLLDNGLQPENVLARMTGVPTTFSVAAGGDTTEPGSIVALQGTLLTVVGDAAGISGDERATAVEARRAGQQLADVILGGPIPVGIADAPPAWPAGGVPTLPAQTTGETLICPDEGVTDAMAREAIARGATTVNDVKRRTRAAMAVCQGRDCLWSIRALLAETDRAWTVPMTARPPATGISVEELAELVTGAH
jgi:bacterioferritin-associated ferredoxin